MACENFEQFLRLASERIPGKRLRERIRKELGDHMADMLADKIDAGTDEEEAKKQVLLEMGNPDALRKAFVRAHIAEMMVQGTVMGITALKSTLADVCEDCADAEIVALAKDLLAAEEGFEKTWKALIA